MGQRIHGYDTFRRTYLRIQTYLHFWSFGLGTSTNFWKI